MKRKEKANGGGSKRPDDNRSNFAQVPSMMKPIPLPKGKQVMQMEAEGT